MANLSCHPLKQYALSFKDAFSQAIKDNPPPCLKNKVISVLPCDGINSLCPLENEYCKCQHRKRLKEATEVYLNLKRNNI